MARAPLSQEIGDKQVEFHPAGAGACILLGNRRNQGVCLANTPDQLGFRLRQAAMFNKPIQRESKPKISALGKACLLEH